jgi:hypothetical protein
MSDCNHYIEQIYIHPDINNLIQKIQPEGIRDDLRQEIAISLLEMPCEKVAGLFAQDNLVKYAIRTCWLMATSKTSPFYYRYKKSDILKAVEYFNSQLDLPTIPESLAVEATKALTKNNIDIETDHEIRIFNKYVELGSNRKVAEYYGIPVNHVCNITNKVKKELRCILLA